MERPDPVGWERIYSWADYRRFLDADMRAHGLRKWHMHMRLQHPELHFQRVLRLVELLSFSKNKFLRILYIPFRIRLAQLSVRTGISVPPGVFGPGLSIAHYGSIVVNDQAKVGSWCRLHSSTNLGVSNGGAPYIGANSYIAPGAVVYGAVRIGTGVAIGANSVVGSDIPDGVTVAGAPAKVISRTGSRLVVPAWFPEAADE